MHKQTELTAGVTILGGVVTSFTPFPQVRPGAFVRFRFGGQGMELSGTVESLTTDSHGEPCAWVEIAGFSGAWKLRERVDLMRVERLPVDRAACDGWCGKCAPAEMCSGVGLE